MRLQSKEYRHYRRAVLVCWTMVFVISGFVVLFGRLQSFLIINGFNSTGADYFFIYFTYLGDGVMWVPLFIYVLVYKRSYFLLLLSAVIISTFMTHLLKRVVYADELRPLKALPQLARAVPLMNGKDAYTGSFPSGHTGTAFTLALLLAVLNNKKWAALIFPLIAFCVGYSRVYLAQHFVTDVLAGIVVGILSSYCAIFIDLYYKKRKRRPAAIQPP